MPKSAKAFRESLKESVTAVDDCDFDALVCWLEHYREGFNPLDFIDDLQNVLDEAKRKLAENGIHIS